DLLVERGGAPEFAPAHMLDGNDLANTILVGITPGRDKGAAALTAAHEYKSNDHRFSIWVQFRKSGTSVAGRPDLKAIKKLLDAAEPNVDWTIEELEREWHRWCRDKERC